MRESIIEMLNRDPFVPFRLLLTIGEGFDVVNPDLVAVGQSQLTLYRPRSDRWEILRLSQVTSPGTWEPAG
jgi:hypothetical protein